MTLYDESDNSNIVPYMFSVGKIERPNCKLCQSDLREKAENLYDNQVRKNYTTIKNTLKQEDDFDISVNAIRNHIIYHYKAAQNNASLQEYANDVNQWVNMQTNKVTALKSRIAIMEREMYSIAQQSEDLDIQERRKSADTIKKLAETILTYENKLGEFREEVKPVNLIFNQLKIIVNDEMQNISSATAKKTLANVLRRLKDNVGSMIVE